MARWREETTRIAAEDPDFDGETERQSLGSTVVTLLVMASTVALCGMLYGLVTFSLKPVLYGILIGMAVPVVLVGLAWIFHSAPTVTPAEQPVRRA